MFVNLTSKFFGVGTKNMKFKFYLSAYGGVCVIFM